MKVDKFIADETEVLEYLNQWKHEEDWTDFNILLSESIVDYEALLSACNWIVDAGAIDSTGFEEGTPNNVIEAKIEKLAKQYRKFSIKKQQAITSRIFKGCNTYACEDCNHVSFVRDGNELMYVEELKTCWECNSKNVTHSIFGKRGAK